MASQLKAVIFDLDGLLIDSEALWSEVRTKIVTSHGGKYTKEIKKMTMGGDYKVGVKKIINILKLPMNVDEFAVLERKMLMKIYKLKIKYMPGAKKILSDVDKNNIPRAIATSSFKKRYKLTIELIDLKGFKTVVTGEEVKNGKPAPDIYLKAEEKLEVGPPNCVVLEDSRYGVKGAKAAGMKAVAVIDKRFSDKQDFTGEFKPDLIVSSLEDLSVEKMKKLFK